VSRSEFLLAILVPNAQHSVSCQNGSFSTFRDSLHGGVALRGSMRAETTRNPTTNSVTSRIKSEKTRDCSLKSEAGMAAKSTKGTKNERESWNAINRSNGIQNQPLQRVKTDSCSSRFSFCALCAFLRPFSSESMRQRPFATQAAEHPGPGICPVAISGSG